jgi:multiple sugar transport system substrate-binding protein
MPEPIEFSICINSDQDTGYLETLIKQHNPKARLHPILWQDEYLELTNFATHGIGPDVSMVGNQTVADLAAMNALSPFSARDVRLFGGEAAFVPVIWRTLHPAPEQSLWDIPWVADPRLLFYWRDMLEKAGIEEQTAFTNAQQMEETLRRLQAKGIQAPWVLAASNALTTYQTAASWVWGAGGDFVSPDGAETCLDEEKTRGGLRSYFQLYRYMPDNSHTLDGHDARAIFLQRRAAATLLDMYQGNQILRSLDPEQRANLGVTLPPGPPYRGGSSLVFWKRSLQDETAKSLIRYLVSPEVQREHCLKSGYLPTRLDTLALPEFANDPNGAVFRQALENGRFFPPMRASGLVQNSISSALKVVWNDRFTQPDEDIDAILSKRLAPISRRLKWVLSQY